MERFAKMLGVTCVAALALAAMTAASASAATFTASATGQLTGTQTTNQVFTTGGGGTVTCTKAHLHGSIIHFAVVGLASTASGFPCTGGSNGTYTGSLVVERVGGGTLTWHP